MRHATRLARGIGRTDVIAPRSSRELVTVEVRYKAPGYAGVLDLVAAASKLEHP